MTPVLRAGLIGAGVMGRNHARILGSLPGVEFVGLADPSGDVHHAAGGAPVVADVDDLLDLGIDYAVVATPTALHLEVGLALAAAGVHAMVEKPLADTAARAEQLAAAFDDAGLVGAVGHIERFNPALQQARRRLEDGELGEVYQVVTRRQGPFPGRIADVGVVKDLATHDIDLTAWVTQRDYVSVAAQTAHRSGRDHEDLVAFVGSLGGGIVTSHLVNWLSPLKERVTVITGERGAFIADTLTADLTFCANGLVAAQWSDLARFRGVSEGDVIRYAIPKPEPLRVEHEQFRDAVIGKPTHVVTMSQGLRTVEVAEAVLASAATGTAVQLDAAEVDR